MRRLFPALALALGDEEEGNEERRRKPRPNMPPLPNLRELAHTARMHITEEEIKDWEPKINAVVDWFGQLSEIDVDEQWKRLGKRSSRPLSELVEEMHLREESNERTMDFDREKMLAAAKNYEAPYFRTPRIMGGEEEASSSSEGEENSNEDVEQMKAAAKEAIDGPTRQLDDDILGFNFVVGEIVKCEKHPDPESSKLLVSTIDCGDADSAPRVVCSGVAVHYENPTELAGKKVVVVGNMKARNMKGVKSHGMCLCASNEDSSKIEFVEAPSESCAGERLTFAGFDGPEQPPIHAENKVAKKKLWDKVKDGFNSDANSCVNWFGSVLIGINGPVKSPSLSKCRVG